MSKVAIQGNASGTGTFTIAAPNSNTDRTLTLPDSAGTIVTSSNINQYLDPPRFHARLTTDMTGQTDETDFDVSFDFEDIDSASAFASNQFTVPSGQGGVYFIYTQVLLQTSFASSDLRDAYVGIMQSSDSGSTFSAIASGGARYANNDINAEAIQTHGIFALSAGDIVKVRAMANSPNSGSIKVLTSITDLGFGEADADFAAKHSMTVFGGYKIA